MNTRFRLPSEIVRVRGQFLIQLTEWRKALADHAIRAGEACDDGLIRDHLLAAKAELTFIGGSGRLLGFEAIAAQAEKIAHQIDLFNERCFGTPNSSKVLTDLILEMAEFLESCKRLTEQPTVLQNINISVPEIDRISTKLG